MTAPDISRDPAAVDLDPDWRCPAYPPIDWFPPVDDFDDGGGDDGDDEDGEPTDGWEIGYADRDSVLFGFAALVIGVVVFVAGHALVWALGGLA